jgi:serine/threonine protein phosphatase PrpC
MLSDDHPGRMKLVSLFSIPRSTASGTRPRDDELDLFGLTHPGRVRKENQDHFLLCTVHPQVLVHATSLPDAQAVTTPGQRIATLMLVADGVGGGSAGSVASRIATEAVTQYVSSALRGYHEGVATNEEQFVASLRAAALGAHEVVRAQAESTKERRGMATTLCLGIVVWPWMYVVQVGDSRCYYFTGSRLRLLTRDQTVAQQLVEDGAMSREDLRTSPFSHVLASAIGASEANPEITKVDVKERGSVILLCTDGLTKHVTDGEIEAAVRTMTSSEQVCRALVQLALDRGGSDNVTLVVGRALKQRT